MHPALSSDETRRLGSALRALLSPLAYRDGDAWRVAVAHRMHDLVGAQQAVFVVEQADAMRLYGVHMDWGTIKAYQAHYGALDFGTARLRKAGIEVWSRRMLWDPDVLAGSEYYNEFAVPNRLHGTVGLSTTIRSLHTGVRIALFNERAGSGHPGTGRQLALLALVLSAFKCGSLIHLRWGPWRARLISALDDAPEPLAVCDAKGRVLHENVALTRALPKGGSTEVLAAIRQVARAIAGATNSGAFHGPLERAVRVAGQQYHIGASAAGPEFAAFGATTLVSVTRQRASARAATTRQGDDTPPREDELRIDDEELRTVYRLTPREVEVTRLLLQRRSNAEVADALTISEHTARHHTENVLLKLGVRSRRDVEKLFSSIVERATDLGGGARGMSGRAD